jgi:hypothetical protein
MYKTVILFCSSVKIRSNKGAEEDILDIAGRKLQDVGENCIMGFTICVLHKL